MLTFIKLLHIVPDSLVLYNINRGNDSNSAVVYFIDSAPRSYNTVNANTFIIISVEYALPPRAMKRQVKPKKGKKMLLDVSVIDGSSLITQISRENY